MRWKTRAQNRLSADVTATATTFNLDSISNFPAVPFRAIIEPGLTTEEIVVVTAKSTVDITFTVVRARQGTTGVAHVDGSLIYHNETIPGDVPILITEKSLDATLTPLESGLIIVTADNKTMTLPTVVGNKGLHYIIKATAAVSTGVTIDGDGSETIDGDATVTLFAENEVVELIAGASEWHIV